MQSILIATKPIIKNKPANIVLNSEGALSTHELHKGQTLTISKVSDGGDKHCVGWYDIATHTNHVCETSSVVDKKYGSCYQCRQKTGFNPGFYYSNEVSDKQREYNNSPHTVYVAFFGGELYKAGIMSDSRGLQRIYEQGAILYVIVGSYTDANAARKQEEGLIAQGLKNSITKRQKQNYYKDLYRIDATEAKSGFEEKLKAIGLEDSKVENNLEFFFYGIKPGDKITPITDQPVSGEIVGVIGSYLVIKNEGRLYGSWLNKFEGYEVVIKDKVMSIEPEPMQSSLF